MVLAGVPENLCKIAESGVSQQGAHRGAPLQPKGFWSVHGASL
jgi:hypothetical protein